jgi:hypothetical protein
MDSGDREKALEPGAEIAQAWLSVRRCDEAVLRAVSVAGESVRASPAIACERVAFVAAELALLRRVDDIGELACRFTKVSELALGVHEVVARLNTAVPLDGP